MDDFDHNFGTRNKSGILTLTEEEGNTVINDYMPTKEFWIENLDENCEYLQAALDATLNKIDGNHYSADFMDSQYSTRIVVRCEPCRCELSSYDPFISHHRGKNHLKTIKTRTTQLKTDRLVDYNLPSKLLNSPKRIWFEGSLEHHLERSKAYVLGMQFIFKERLYDGSSDTEDKYSCQLCNVTKVNFEKMIKHLTRETSHNRLYLKIKFGIEVKQESEYRKLCRHYEEKEGKINHHIVDFSKQNKMISEGLNKPVAPDMSGSSYIRSRSPPRQLTKPRPLVAEKSVQVDSDALDENVPLSKELFFIKANKGEDIILEDFSNIELMLETLQTLNLKLHKYYTYNKSALAQGTVKYQSYISGIYDELKKTPDFEDLSD